MKQDYNDLITRFNQYKTGGKGKVVLKSGERGKATADAEEIMAQMNNAVAIGALKLEDIETMPSIKDFINGISKDIFGDSSWMFDLKTANDVFNFIKNYQSNIQEGIKLALPDDEDDIKKASKTIDLTKQSNQDKLNDLVGSTNEQGFYTVSKDEFTGSQAETVAKQLVDNGAFDNLIGAKIKVTDPKQRQDILEDSREEIKLHIERFNPSLNKSLFGYINTYIGAKVGTVAKKALKAPKTITTDKKIGGEESKTTIGETLVSDEISPEDYTDMQLAKEKLDKIEPQQSKIAEKIDLTDNEINLAKRDIIGFLRKTDRPDMTDPKKFFKALVDYTTGKGVQPGGFAKVIYDKLSLPKDGKLSTKNKEAFIREIAEDLIALNKVDPAVMRRSKWTPFYELEIKRMNTKQTQKAIDEGRIPSTTNLEAGNDLFKILDPSVDQVVEYLNNIRPDVLKRKMPKFLGEVIIKNEFNEIVDNPKQPVYDAKGNETDNTIDLSESITEEEVTRGAPQVREKIARPKGVKFNKAVKNIENLTVQVNPEFEGEIKNIDQLLSTYINDKTYKHDSKTAIDDFFTDVEKIWAPNLPKDLITKTVLRPSNRILAKKGKIKIKVDGVETTTDEYFVNKRDNFLKNKEIKYGKPFTGKAKDYKYGITYSKYFGSTPEEISKTNTKGKTRGKGENKITQNIKQINAMHLSMHKQLWERVFKSIRENNKNAKAWGNYFSLVGVDVTHPHRMGAEMLGWSKNPIGYEGKLYEWEHAMPATRAYLYLLIASLDKNFSKSDFEAMYDLVIKNFKLIALDNYDDKVKIKGAGRTTSMGKGWSIVTDSWFNRYFDEIIGKIQGGIDPSSIQGLDNKTFTEELNIDSNGNSTNNNLQKLKKFSKSTNIKDLSNEVVKFNKNITNEGIIGYAKTVDEALSIARNPNAPVKKIRVFDFDDTLAKSKSLVFYNRPNDSGKPVPNNKAIFMIGGPGSGKSNIGKGLQLGRDGWKVVNQDIFIETEKAKAGLPESEKDYTKEQRSKRAKIGAAGRKAAEAKMDKYTKAGNGMVIDGTGASYNATMKKVNKLKEQGYEVFMVHAKTSNEVALERNRARKERSLPDFIVEKTQESVNNNISQYKSDLGDNFIEIDTETIEYGKPLPKEFVNDAKAKFYATERGKLNAEEFAEQGAGLIEEGFAMDFSDFNIVREGEKGPLFDVAKKIQKARGTDDVFVLTARAPEAQQAIYEFLKSEGLEIPLENITGLGNSTGEAKANWLVDKAAEGYNDFYFADDAYQNVKAVKDAMSVLDVKSKVQQAKVKFSKSVNKDFNKIIEQTTGIGAEKIYSEAKAKVRGANKGNKKFFIPYSAEDFMGLIYPLLSKGKLGDSQMAWFKQNLLDPYARAQENISADRLQLMEDFKALKKALDVPKDLRKKTDSGFTKEQAIRVYLFNKAGFDVPGISKTDLNELLDLVNSDGILKAFGDQIFNITKGDGYAKPGENWLVGTITTDLIDVLNTVKRAKYLEQSGYTANVELIFSKENLNKLEAAYGTKYREAMENILGRMKSGKNRLFSGNRLSNRVLDYINNSTGAIMFFNTRSAVLQTISSINFLNWSFNNPIKAGAAFANQKQYWKDFVDLINSDYLVDRRNGLKLNINESEIADAAATSKNKARAAINYILQKGFLPTQYADSFAIASGGATFYRNRINDLVENQGMSEADAKKQAMLEWRETAEISQQSSDPSKISAQQASDLGRVILAFANTPMQYARIQKRALQDLINGRGDAKTNVSKIIYYAVVQNLIFNALQSALFKLGFDEEEDEKKEKMYLRTANGMLDSQLRGLGLAGATVSVIKNFLTDIYERSGRSRPEYVDSVYELLRVSPPISSKISKIRQAAYQFDSKKRREEIFKKGFNIDNPAYEAFAKVISATVNVPLDRVYSKLDNISGAMSEDAETWQTIAMLAGWPKWNIMPNSKESSSFSRGNVKIKRRKLKRKTLRK